MAQTEQTQQLLNELQEKYCPPLDTALFLSIISDLDVTKKDDLETAHSIFGSLVEGVDVEEASGFDPSGSSGGVIPSPDHSNERSESGHSRLDWSSNTDDTSLSQGLSALEIDSGSSEPTIKGHTETGSGATSPIEHDTQWDGLDMAAKEALLIETFPAAKSFSIKLTLKRCKGDMSLAIDHLLNQSFLEQSGERPKGIEAFSQSEDPIRHRKAKGKKKRSNFTEYSDFTSEEQDSTPSTPDPEISKWDNAAKAVEFMSERLNMPPTQVSSIYHQNGGSMQATISALVDAQIALGMDNKEQYVQRTAQTLSLSFPSVTIERLLAVVQLSYPNSVHAYDIAKALTTRSPSSSARGTPIQISFHLPPPDLGDSSPSDKLPKTRVANSLYPEDSAPYLPSTTKELSTMRASAFNNASAAFKKGRSDPLMGGAAAYYASVGRDLTSRLHASTASEMDRLVSSQSTSDMCDLHGCDVKNATRIAKERVRGWWASGRDNHGGYRVVTGKGSHSEGGKSKLQPAVVKMLMSEGWKVEVGSGSVLVRGVNGPAKRKY